MTARHFGVLSTLSLFVLTACAEPPTVSSAVAPSPQSSRAARAVRTADSVLLAMRVTDGPPYAVQSDGLGEYVHGIAGMSVIIDVDGNLQITPATSSGGVPPARRLNVTYGSGQRWTYPSQVNFKITSNRTNNGNPRLQDMPVGSSLCYNVTVAHRDAAVQLVNRYNPAAYSASTHVLITRGASASWTMQTQGVATSGLSCGVPDLAWVSGTDLLVKRGSFTVGAEQQAFHIELRALP